MNRALLGSLTKLGTGGFGTVHEVAGVPLSGVRDPVVFKELNASLPIADRTLALASMTQAVAYRNGLSRADQQDLDEFTVWPLAMVIDGRHPVGCLMRKLPAECYIRTPVTTVELTLSWLCAKATQAQRVGLETSGFDDATTRLALLVQLVYAVGRLHRHGRVYGDLSLKNVAFSLNPPQVYLMDCDATADANDLARRQGHSPGFCPPECDPLLTRTPQPLQDKRTDVYKLGLCVIRGLTKGRGATQARNPDHLVGTLRPESIRVLHLSVADRAHRPTAAEMFAVLVQDLHTRISPPVITRASVSRSVVLRGGDIQASWHVDGATGQRLIGPNSWIVELPPHIDRYSFRVPTSGHYQVEVNNRHGVVRQDLGHLEVFELPEISFDTLRLPPTGVPDLPSVQIPAAFAGTPPPPAIPTVSTCNLEFGSPDISAATSQLEALLPHTHPLASATDIVTGLGDQISGIADELTNMASSLSYVSTTAAHRIRQVVESALPALAQHHRSVNLGRRDNRRQTP